MSASVHSPTVLVVDDDAWMRSVLADLLPEEGYSVAEASDGASGIRQAKADRPDVVILDLAMPELSGVDVLRELKKDHGTNGIPVIVCSASAAQLPEDCTPQAEAVMQKPIDLTNLLGEIGRVTGQS